MDTQEVKRQHRLNQWIEIVRQCRSSGQTVSTWCAENNINPKRYYYWLRCVRMAACELLPTIGSHETSIVPLTLPNLRIPEYPDGESGGIRTLFRQHADSNPEASGHLSVSMIIFLCSFYFNNRLSFIESGSFFPPLLPA